MKKKYFLLLLTGFIFGSQFLFTKNALQAYSPTAIGMIRLWIGFLTLTLVSLFSPNQATMPATVKWYHYACIGFLEAALPSFLIPWGQQFIDTSLCSILICTVPLFTLILGPLLIRTHPFNWTDCLSTLLGFIGIVLLFNPSYNGITYTNLVPKIAVLSASLCWALSIISIKKLPPVPPILFTRNMLFAASLETTLLWFFTTTHHALSIHLFPLSNIFILGVFSSGFVFVFYVLLIKLGGVNFASFSNYLVPVVGIGIGLTLLNESININEIIGTFIIISSLIIQTVRDYTIALKAKT